MPYTLRFSDESKPSIITVPDMPPGINTIDTSLSFVGRGYPNYGEKFASNFLHLLENFSSPLPPTNPIEGQLWYDTSDPHNKVLRIMDGTSDSTRWPSANGIYQQGTDPKDSASAGLKNGDIWVDTVANQLKIYNSSAWTLVGPATSAGNLKTGTEPATIQSTTNINYKVILNYVNGEVVSIIANNAFTPKTVIEGFSILNPGITVSTKYSGKFYGTSISSQTLEINNVRYAGTRFLRKDDTSTSPGQVITGRIFFQTPTSQTGSQGRDGVVINTTALNSEYIQLHKYYADAVLLNNTPGGKIIFKTKPDSMTGLVNGLTIENTSVAINTSTNSNYALDIFGSMRISGNVTLGTSSDTVTDIVGDLSITRNLVTNNLIVNTVSTLTNIVTVGSTSSYGTIVSPGKHNSYDLGSTTNYFRSMYVSTIGSTGTGTTLYGRVVGQASSLSASTEFRVQGQVTATSFAFSGTGTAATFNTELTPSAITAHPNLFTATASLTLLAIDTAPSAEYQGLRQITRSDFLRGVFPTSMIVPFGGSIIPLGWFLCDGSSYLTNDFEALSNSIRSTYGGPDPYSFYVPDMRYSTTSTQGYISYIIKT